MKYTIEVEGDGAEFARMIPELVKALALVAHDLAVVDREGAFERLKKGP